MKNHPLKMGSILKTLPSPDENIIPQNIGKGVLLSDKRNK